MAKVQKIRFNGRQGQKFKIGTLSFAAGIWYDISPADTKRIIEMEIQGMFSFDPELKNVKDAGEDKNKKEAKKEKKAKKKKKPKED